ncbi:protein FAR1-RELATED SEQUENCE 5-like [Carya illinoinensis]|uniref:protein FAR1-RELATED SEQUENCE 5-like n=1 Tax=Carya illinoinensis TaxID=32201 RepID=UPI001C71E251|nr:protein FAR1-RELATED SEQUENCE 5-like [Carya illinoinensis]
MEKGKDHAYPITRSTADSTTNPSTNPPSQMIAIPFYPLGSTSPTANPSTNLPTQVIPIPCYLDFSNYMHGCHPPMPNAWLPPFFECPEASASTQTSQGNPLPPCESNLNPSSGLHSASSSHVDETQDPTPESTGKSMDTVNGGSDDLSGPHDNVPQTEGADIVEEPKLGMVFKSEEDLLSYYKRYGQQCGFGIMTQRSHRFEDGSLRYVTLGCARGGKARNRMSNVARPRPTSKTDCKARINVTLERGVLKVNSVDNSHNHGLSPQKSRFFRCNREVSESVKRVLDINDQAGIRMNKSFASLVQEAGGFENLPFNEKDCRNYIDKARHLRLGKGGAGALREYFARMQYKNDGFFSLMDMDDDGRLRNVFWADARSRAAYKYFGDVVTFDTTYLTNRYGMPFAPFVGVNHHGQSILLGAGLISSEDTETFTWLFQTWCNCMDGEAPKAIITDQDRAMKNAISLVFPNSRHRFCLWHILKKLPEKLGSHGEFKTGLKTGLLNCVYDSHTVEEFEGSWEVLITKYNLQDNAWLKSLYAEHTYWAPVFMKDVFWAGMSTTQRSESMNAFFDGYVHAKTNLKEFVDQFDNALRKKIENESAADFQSFNVTIPIVSPSPLEKTFQDIYTCNKFREVQKEVIGMLATLPTLHRKDGVIATYNVEDEVNVDDFIKEVTHTVYFNEAECEVKCSCALFEMRGVLCRHVLGIMRVNKVRSVPEKYILDRWRKDIKRTYTLIRSSYDGVDERPEVCRYSRIIKKCNEVATNASSCDEHTEDMLAKLDAMNLGYRTNKPPSKVNVTTTAVPTTTATSKNVLSPHVVRGKGRPPSLRKKSMIEHIKPTTKKATQKGKRKQPHGVEGEVVGTRRNLFGSTVVGTQQSVTFQPPQNTTEVLDFSVTELDFAVNETQESMQLHPDGTQLDHEGSMAILHLLSYIECLIMMLKISTCGKNTLACLVEY